MISPAISAPARRGLLAAIAGLALGLGATGCASSEDPTTLTVYAAASLQEPFEELAAQFEAAHDDVDVALSVAGSSTLAAQIREGAPADVFASADTANMDKLEDAEPTDFATNTLMIAVPPGNPAGITDLSSLTGDGVRLVVCAPEVPCGAAAEKVQDAAGLDFSPVSEEQSVTDVLGKVTSGEAGAGLVYVTDVQKAGDAVEGITFPEAASAVNTYPITAVPGTAHPDLGEEFIDLVLGEDGRTVLSSYGFAGA
ncbi:molybdate ABC transporter substrate-binding protein [Brachybacterium sp. GCM10030252]|uniref:molybdate ABC transporter substrate-binding protein n=1 Tax=Brachybacterium sp. GCM10030252 TaxID=3273380 RepID=UPI00361D7632